MAQNHFREVIRKQTLCLIARRIHSKLNCFHISEVVDSENIDLQQIVYDEEIRPLLSNIRRMPNDNGHKIPGKSLVVHFFTQREIFLLFKEVPHLMVRYYDNFGKNITLNKSEIDQLHAYLIHNSPKQSLKLLISNINHRLESKDKYVSFGLIVNNMLIGSNSLSANFQKNCAVRVYYAFTKYKHQNNQLRQEGSIVNAMQAKLDWNEQLIQLELAKHASLSNIVDDNKMNDDNNEINNDNNDNDHNHNNDNIDNDDTSDDSDTSDDGDTSDEAPLIKIIMKQEPNQVIGNADDDDDGDEDDGDEDDNDDDNDDDNNNDNDNNDDDNNDNDNNDDNNNDNDVEICALCNYKYPPKAEEEECGMRGDRNIDWIQCDYCEEWIHAACAGGRTKLKRYRCDYC